MTELVRHLASTLPSIALKTGNASKVNLKHATSATSGLGVALESVKSGTPLVFLDVRPRPSLADATDRAALVAAARREHEKFCDQLVANGTPETLDCCSIACAACPPPTHRLVLRLVLCLRHHCLPHCRHLLSRLT
jgi:hypothetical protein